MPHNALDLLYEIEDSRFDLDGNIDLKIFNLAEFKKLINLQKEPIEPDIEPLPFSRSTEQFLTVFRDFILLLTSIKNHPTTPREFIGDSLITPINEFMRESLDSLGKKANTSQRLNQKLCVSRLREFLNAIQYTITEKMALPLDNTQHNLLTQLHDHIKESLLFYTGHEAEEYYSPRLQIKLRYPAFKDASIELGEIYHRYAAEQAYSPTLALASSEAYAYYVRYVAKDLISPVFDTALTQADTEEEPFVKIIKQRLLGEAPLNASNRISVARWYVLETGLQAVRLLENLNQKNTTPLAQSNDPLKISVFESDFAGGMCYIKNALLDSHLTRGSEQLKLFISDTYNVLTRLGDLEKIHLGQPVDEQLTYWEKLNPFSFGSSPQEIIKRRLLTESISINPRTSAKAGSQFYFACALSFFKTTVTRASILNDAVLYVGEDGEMDKNMPLMTGIQRHLTADPEYHSRADELVKISNKIKLTSIPRSKTESLYQFFTFSHFASSQRHNRNLAKALVTGDTVIPVTSPHRFFNFF